MLDPESPFYVRPRLRLDLARWGYRFWRSANAEHVARSSPLLRDLLLASRAGFEELAALSTDDFGLTKKGLLMLCKTEHGLAEEAHTAERARALGIPAEVLTAAQAQALDPALRMDVAGAVYFPLDSHLTPGRLMATLKRETERAGVELAWNEAVTGWRVEGSRLEAVRTTAGERTADEFVLCSGAWSTAMARDLRLDMPMLAGKGYSLTLDDPPGLPSLCSILTEAWVAVTPMGKALRFAGTMELGGIDTRVNPARIRGILKSVPRYFPELTLDHFRDVKAWAGLRPCSPDGLPYLGRFARYANLSAATGHAMMGVSLGPITGKLLAEILSGEKPSLEIGALRPDRYS